MFGILTMHGHTYRNIRVGNCMERPGSDIVRQGYLKKLKTMKKKFFVLRSTSSSGPARLDYYDSEKKFKTFHPPKRSIPLHNCFNINKKSDTKHKFAIALYLNTDCFSIITESEVEQEDWLSLLLEYQNEYLAEGESGKIHYEHVWQGTIKAKSPRSIPNIAGGFRLCLSEKSVVMVKVNEYHPTYTFQFSSIRRCGHSDNFFFMEVGRSSVTGTGELWMQVEETPIAQSMHDAVLAGMAAARPSQSDQPSSFRRRSNTSGSTVSSHQRNTFHGDEIFHRKRATSESHHSQGSPRRNRSHVMQRPQSSVVFSPKSLTPNSNVSLGSSPGSAFDHSSFMDEARIRSDSMGSRSSYSSRHSDMVDAGCYENSNTPSMTPENSFIMSAPGAEYSITEEDQANYPGSNSDYLSMTPGQRTPSQRSMTPSPTRGQALMEKSTLSSDYLPMTPGRRSGTPSPTRLERPGSSGSESQEMASRSEGYMDMRPGSVISSPASNHSGYIDMTPPASNKNSYIDMTPGQRTPTDPGPGYMVMDGGRTRPTAPIPIRTNKEPGYMDMGPSSQPLATVKEGGSGEAYLPMSPTGQSPVSSASLKPAKVISYLSDDSMSGEFPKRAYSVGSRPTPKPTHRYHQPLEQLQKQPLDSSKSSSAPHLIVQKSRSPQVELLYRNMSYQDSPLGSTSLSQSVKSDDCDSFMEMDFYRPRTASDSYGCRPRASSFGKQYTTPQGHRPRASSYGQASRGKLAKHLEPVVRTDSFESMKTTSQDLSSKKWSQESLGKFSSSSRNSSFDSLKKYGEDHQSKSKNISSSSDYMDMQIYDKRETPSPHVQGVVSPKPDRTGYVDMTLGTSAPKSVPHGLSPSSSTHSLGSSPASVGHGHYEKGQDAKIIKASGKVIQKQSFMSPQSSENQLKVSTSRLKKNDKRSPSSSGKESEDESYVPFQPINNPGQNEELPQMMHSLLHDRTVSHGTSFDKMMSHGTSHDKLGSHGSSHDIKSMSYSTAHDRSPSFSSHEKSRGSSHDKLHNDNSQKSHLTVKIQHGYSKSLDSAMKSPEGGKTKNYGKFDIFKSKKDEKHKSKHHDEKKHNEKHDKGDKLGNKPSPKMSKSKTKNEESLAAVRTALQEKVAKGQSPTLDKKIEFIPDSDLFSNKIFLNAKPVDKTSTTAAVSAVADAAKPASDTGSYMDFCPGFETALPGKRESEENKSKTPPLNTVNEYQKPVKHVDRLYDEIEDLTSSLEAKSQEESDYMLSEPSSKDASSSNIKSDFSYMDFDPDVGKTPEVDQSKPIKVPTRVKSFVAHEANPVVSIDETEVKTDDGHSENIKGMCRGEKLKLDSSGCVTEQSGDKCVNSSSNVGQPDTLARDNNQNEEKGEGHCSNNSKNVIWDIAGQKRDSKGSLKLCSVDEANATFIIKQTLPAGAHADVDLLQDEGYVDLDFSDKAVTTSVLTGRSHHRSGSSSSNNSDRSRKFVDIVSCDDDIRCPETPKSYIQDDSAGCMPETPLSYISDHGHVSDNSRHSSETGSSRHNSSETSPGIKDLPGSPWKQQFPGKFSSSVPGTTPVKSVSCGLAACGVDVVGDSAVRKTLPFSRSPLPPPMFSQSPGGALSRQCSVPIAPSYSPRTSADRSRKASGPPSFPSVKTGNGNTGGLGLTGSDGLTKRGAPPTLAPTPSQELLKQKSMPCMNFNFPTTVEKPKIGDNLQEIMHGHSRHSFTDLSQYEEMTLPGNDLSHANEGKSNSQQLYTDNSQETKLNYVELELTGSTENMDDKSPRVKKMHPSSNDDLSQAGAPVSYAEIDYLKTESMKNTNNKDVKFTL